MILLGRPAQATADSFVEAGIPVILSSAGLSFYLDGECSGYNHQAWQCTYWGPDGTTQPVDLIRPHYTSAQRALVLGGEVSMWYDHDATLSAAACINLV